MFGPGLADNGHPNAQIKEMLLCFSLTVALMETHYCLPGLDDKGDES